MSTSLANPETKKPIQRLLEVSELNKPHENLTYLQIADVALVSLYLADKKQLLKLLQDQGLCISQESTTTSSHAEDGLATATFSFDGRDSESEELSMMRDWIREQVSALCAINPELKNVFLQILIPHLESTNVRNPKFIDTIALISDLDPVFEQTSQLVNEETISASFLAKLGRGMLLNVEMSYREQADLWFNVWDKMDEITYYDWENLASGLIIMIQEGNEILQTDEFNWEKVIPNLILGGEKKNELIIAAIPEQLRNQHADALALSLVTNFKTGRKQTGSGPYKEHVSSSNEVDEFVRLCETIKPKDLEVAQLLSSRLFGVCKNILDRGNEEVSDRAQLKREQIEDMDKITEAISKLVGGLSPELKREFLSPRLIANMVPLFRGRIQPYNDEMFKSLLFLRKDLLILVSEEHINSIVSDEGANRGLMEFFFVEGADEQTTELVKNYLLGGDEPRWITLVKKTRELGKYSRKIKSLYGSHRDLIRDVLKFGEKRWLENLGVSREHDLIIEIKDKLWAENEYVQLQDLEQKVGIKLHELEEDDGSDGVARARLGSRISNEIKSLLDEDKLRRLLPGLEYESTYSEKCKQIVVNILVSVLTAVNAPLDLKLHIEYLGNELLLFLEMYPNTEDLIPVLKSGITADTQPFYHLETSFFGRANSENRELKNALILEAYREGAILAENKWLSALFLGEKALPADEYGNHIQVLDRMISDFLFEIGGRVEQGNDLEVQDKDLLRVFNNNEILKGLASKYLGWKELLNLL